MDNSVVEVQILGLMPLEPHPGASLFLGNSEKVFDIAVDVVMYHSLRRALAGETSPRPLSHELIARILRGFEITLERVVINDLEQGTYFARLILRMQNEVGTKLVELDARPSDSIVLAIQAGRPILVARSVFDKVEDKSAVLRALEEQGQLQTGASDSERDDFGDSEEEEDDDTDDDGDDGVEDDEDGDEDERDSSAERDDDRG